RPVAPRSILCQASVIKTSIRRPAPQLNCCRPWQSLERHACCDKLVELNATGNSRQAGLGATPPAHPAPPDTGGDWLGRTAPQRCGNAGRHLAHEVGRKRCKDVTGAFWPGNLAGELGRSTWPRNLAAELGPGPCAEPLAAPVWKSDLKRRALRVLGSAMARMHCLAAAQRAQGARLGGFWGDAWPRHPPRGREPLRRAVPQTRYAAHELALLRRLAAVRRHGRIVAANA